MLSIASAGASPGAAAATRAHSSVVGGSFGDYAQWPFAAAIFRKGRMHCGGSVISPTQILTAAHCVFDFNLANFTVVTGRDNLRDGATGQVIPVASGRVHPDYATTALHDVAVLNLAQPTTAPPIALATPSEDPALTAPGTQLRVAGWGATNPIGFRLSAVLKSTIESVRTAQRCLRAYTRDLFNPQSMICALGKRRKNGGRFKLHTSICSGDSGGPLVADTPAGPREVGTVSFSGALCGLPGGPAVYSRVSDSLGFIFGG
jgi:secreted trypsin-like serine protease